MYALEIMGKGMFSIFAVIILLTFIVYLMAKITEIRRQKVAKRSLIKMPVIKLI